MAANNYRVKMRSKTKTYHVNVLKTYIAKEPEVDVVHTSNKDDATIAVAGGAGGSTRLTGQIG